MSDLRGKKPLVAFTGGGTGGHIYPGLAVIERLKTELDAEFVWIGSSKGMDRSIVEAAGVPFVGVSAGKLRRNLSLKTVPDAFRVLAGYFQSRKILAKLAPSLLFSKGGYVSVPPCAAARSLGIPVMTHESDTSPGLATRLNARFAETVLVSYPETLPRMGRAASRTVVVGNPVRPAFFSGNPDRGRAFLGAPSGTPVVFAMGGSQGATQVNDLLRAALPVLDGKCFVAHQTGPGRDAPPDVPGRYRAFEYVGKELPDVLACTDLLVTRAGAGSLWECAAAGKAMYLVPLAGAGTRGDQVENAELFARRGAALVYDAEPDPRVFVDTVLRLVTSTDERSRLGAAAKAFAGFDAAKSIAGIITERLARTGREEA